MEKNDFYTIFAKYYHNIFPVNENNIASFENYLIPGKLLDVGCGSGEYTKFFHDKGFDVIGIDLSETMIQTARKRHPNVNFDIANMLTYSKPNTFDNIICLGSTIAHLNSKEEIRRFIQLSSNNLKQRGIIVIKTLDYSFVTEKGIMTMPTIVSNDGKVTLKRNYEVKDGELYFLTTLQTPDGIFESKTKLFAVTQKIMEEIMVGLKFNITKNKEQMTIIIQK